MNYEKKYKEAFERARAKYAMKDQPIHQDLVDIFPELAESEEERIRKDLIKLVEESTALRDVYDLRKMSAWLEKQGEQKPADEPKFKVGDWICHTVYKKPLLIVEDLGEGDFRTEPKSIITAKEFREGFYRLWTIQDAKDGDVLAASSFSSDCIFIFDRLDKWKFDEPNGERVVATGHCCLTLSADNMEFGIQGPDSIEVDTVKPATKIQRDLLEKAMADAGYSFDFEKKELKKVEQKPVPKFKVGDVVRSSNGVSLLIVGITDYCYNCVTCATNDEYSFDFDIQDEFELVEQKFTEWSEEDENLLKLSLENLTELKDRFGKEYGKVGDCIDWLKSLKDRYTWKPSKEQLIALEFVLNYHAFASANNREQIQLLYNDLQKLREE